MNTLTGGKSKKQAGLGDIDSRLAEIRDIFAGIFPAPPDKLVVLIFLLLYLEVIYGFLKYLQDELNTVQGSADLNECKRSSIFEKITLFNKVAEAIGAQFFVEEVRQEPTSTVNTGMVKRYVKLLEIGENHDSNFSIYTNKFDKAIEIFSDDLSDIDKVNQIKNKLEQKIRYIIGSGSETGLEKEIFTILDPLTGSLTPTGRLIVGTFLLIYLEALYGFLPEDANGLTDNFNKAASAIKQEYCYSLHDQLLHGDLKDKFEAVFTTLNSTYESERKKLIREVETQIFYRLNPLIPF
jgi:hypothetical protein